jgi:hypothetical protein
MRWRELKRRVEAMAAYTALPLRGPVIYYPQVGTNWGAQAA